MLSRRELLVGGLVLAGCTRSRTPTWSRRSVHEGVEFVELFPHDASESSPLVVAIHGRGDTPDNWIEPWQNFPAAVQIALPHAPDRFGGGFTWFEYREGMTDEQFGAEVGAAEDRLWKGIAKLAGKRRILVTGFSQGGILSFAIASRHADRVAAAFPVSGSCPGPLLPKNHARAAPIVAFHGTVDEVLNIKWGRGAVDAFKEQGNQAVMREYPGVGHTLTAQMKADVWAEIQKALATL
jgi:phospholipase/carboxylesterase